MYKRQIRLNDREFCGIVAYLRDNYGINLEKKQVLIECRMARELEKRGLTSFAQYMEQMRSCLLYTSRCV